MIHFQSKQVPLSNILKIDVQTGFQVREQRGFVFYGNKEALSQSQRHYKLIQVKDAKPGEVFQN